MQVTIDKQYPVAAPAEAAWAVLADMRELAACMPGGEIVEQVDERRYKGSVRVKVGPASAAFAGDLEVLEADAAARSLRLIGKGADKGGSSASMELAARLLPAGEDGGCSLAGKADVIVNGKFAQMGGRMMGSVSDMVLAQFAANFSARAAALAAPVVDVAGAEEPAAEATAGQGPGTAPPARELNALALAWALFKQYCAGLFRRLGGRRG